MIGDAPVFVTSAVIVPRPGSPQYGTIDRPGPTGRGLYLLSTAGVGPLDVLFEYKDYRAFWLRNSGGVPYNLPPSAIRDHTYTLLNRHPHVLDPDDEKGYQLEGSLRIGNHTLLGNLSHTRNRDDADVFNYFDEIYGEFELALGAVGPLDDVTVINAYDYQKSFASGLTPDPFRRLHTSIHEARLITDPINSFRVQFEHQHNESDLEGEFDSWFGLLEWSRSPDLTLNLVGETSNRSDVQLAAGERADALYGIVSYHVSENHDVSVLYGSRLAGFVCVGGVCRLEPEFEGIEVRLLSRF